VVQWRKTNVSRTVSILIIRDMTTPKFVHRQISKAIGSLMTRTKVALEAMVYLPFNHLTRLLA
jgi:hypothetical protein